MGNCQDQFSNVPNIQQEWDDRQRQNMSSVSVINRTHMKVEPQRIQQLKIGALREDYVNKQIDNQRLYDTRPLNQQNFIRFNQNKLVQSRIEPQAAIQELSLDFYHELALPDYSYPEIPQNYASQYEELEINENTDRYGVKYIGEWKNNEIHGNGVLSSNTKKYIGQFKNGLKHFHGRQIQRRQVYEGQFENGRRKGTGIRYLTDRIEEGTFDQILIEGKIAYKNGNTFIGTLLNGQFNGPKCQYEDTQAKIRYGGQFSKGKMTGQGNIYYPNGAWYQGQLVEGLKHGKGEFHWNENTSYRGNYKLDQRNGPGELRTGGKVFEGNFKNGMLDGGVIFTEGNLQTRKNFAYGKQIDQGELSIDQNGLPEHWT